MARVQLVIADPDRDRFVHQAQREGMSLSAWLRAAAEERLERRARAQAFQSLDELRAFFDACDARGGSGDEPDWAQHRAVIDGSRRRGAADT